MAKITKFNLVKLLIAEWGAKLYILSRSIMPLDLSVKQTLKSKDSNKSTKQCL